MKVVHAIFASRLTAERFVGRLPLSGYSVRPYWDDKTVLLNNDYICMP